MTFKSELFIAALYGFITLTEQSIAGVTYMDDFGFEQRYRNLYECNPFYWQPLHMPEHCRRIFEELIREGIGSLGTVRIVKDQRSDYDGGDIDDDTMPPYEKMVELLKKDTRREPSDPEITFFPGLGAAALYHQPVSQQSGDYMKIVAKAYKDISFGFGPLYNPIDNSPTENNISKEQKEQMDRIIGKLNFGGESLRNNNVKNKPRYNIKKKINKSGLITILRTKHH